MTELRRIPTPYSYSAAVEAGDFVSIGLHRGFGDDFTTQLDDSISRLQKTLAEFDLTLANLVEVYVWLKDIRNVPEMEERFRNYFKEDKYPARMGATTEFIDDDCLLMIDGIAYKG